MHVADTGLCLALLALAAEPASATPSASFQVAALSDASLDSVRGGFRLTDGQFVAIGDVAARDQFRFSASVAGLIMDNWWSSQGAELIANSPR